MTHAEKEIRNEEIVKLRHCGKSMSEIAEIYGLTQSGIRSICKRYGVDGVMSDRRIIAPKNQYTNGTFDREANAIRYIDERTPGFEYAGNYSGIDGYVDLKCKVCGSIVHKSFVSVRHGTATCPTCEENKRIAAKEDEHRKHIQHREERKRIRLATRPSKQMTFPVCKCCGAMFIPKTGKQKYCTEYCMQKIHNAIKKDRRLKKLADRVVDKGITLEKLYRRDNGKCYLCGCVCDWNDYERRDNGTFIAGGSYPSIDHVVPLKKGGVHSWENIKLACRKCNIEKRDNAPVSEK